MRLTCAGLFLAGVLTAVGAEEKKKASQAPLTDAEFVMKAASSDLTEIAMSTMAKDMAKSSEVKTFSEKMITDHTKSSEELKTIIADSGLTIPAAPLPPHQKHLDMLKKGSGADFDKTYMKLQVMHHKEALDLVTRGSKQLQNEKLKAFATKLVPVVKEHTEMAKKISDGAGKGENGAKSGTEDKSDK